MIYDKEKFTSKLKYPVISDYTTYHIYSEGEVLFRNLSTEEVLQYKRGNRSCISETVTDMDTFKKAREVYAADQARLDILYAEELFATVNFSKAICELVYSEAWEYSHAWGYEEVENKFYDLLEFVEALIKIIKEEEKA